MPERHLIMCDVGEPLGYVEAEPLVVSVESGMVRLEFDSWMFRCPLDELRSALGIPGTIPARRAV